ncbi:MAG: hypothetical protein LBL92_05480 [Propionibacteriaceae bacterium]|nr:hypothetical protein [Propionibacteriaceae bacterium]
MTIDWIALLQVAIVTIVAAVAIVGLMSLANWLLGPVGAESPPSAGRRLTGQVLIVVMALIILGGLYLIVHEHVARLLGFG